MEYIVLAVTISIGSCPVDYGRHVATNRRGSQNIGITISLEENREEWCTEKRNKTWQKNDPLRRK